MMAWTRHRRHGRDAKRQKRNDCYYRDDPNELVQYRCLLLRCGRCYSRLPCYYHSLRKSRRREDGYRWHCYCSQSCRQSQKPTFEAAKGQRRPHRCCCSSPPFRYWNRDCRLATAMAATKKAAEGVSHERCDEADIPTIVLPREIKMHLLQGRRVLRYCRCCCRRFSAVVRRFCCFAAPSLPSSC